MVPLSRSVSLIFVEWTRVGIEVGIKGGSKSMCMEDRSSSESLSSIPLSETLVAEPEYAWLLDCGTKIGSF